MTKRQQRTNLTAILIGCTASALVLWAYAGGALDRLEWMTLDLRFRFTNSITPSDQIVCLDIIDRDLELAGRWPWPRDVQAALVSVPAECGATAILVDLTWTEPEPERTVVPDQADILSRTAEISQSQPAEQVYPDLVLAHSVAIAGNVYLAYHHAALDLERSPAFAELVEAVRRGDADASHLAARIDARLRAGIEDDKDYALQRPLTRARMVAALLETPALDEVQLATRLDITEHEFLERAFERCLETALRQRLVAWLNADERRWMAEPGQLVPTFYGTLTDHPFSDDSALRRAAGRAYREVLSYAATTRRELAPLAKFAPFVQPVDGLTPVYFKLARVARRCCFANYKPDGDGTVRRVALVERHGDRLLSQLGFSVAWDELGVTEDGVAAEPRWLTLRPKDGARGPLTIQLDAEGRTLVPWVAGTEWTRQFRHVPASAVLQLTDLRRNLKRNGRESRRLLQLVLSSEFLPDFNAAGKDLAERPALEQQQEMAELTGDVDSAGWYGQQIQKIDDEVARAEQALRSRIAQRRKELEQGAAGGEGLSAKVVDDVSYYLGEVDRLRAADGKISGDIDETLARLRPIFHNKLCVVGYAAVSLADMVPIPTHPRSPGLMAHANLLSGLLTGQLVTWLTPGVNAIIAAILGLLSAAISTYLRPRLAFLLIVFVIVSFVLLAGAVGFYQYRCWVAITPTVGAVLFSFFCIAVYRYVFIDSERRQLTTALGQYTSATLARKMAEDADLCRRAEKREVSAMFTDLRGFTTISERIGAERTQRVLNAVLGRCTEVMLRHEAMINKFIGDGVFAFWNPLIYPQPDHALRACETAIDLHVALRDLAEEQRRAGGDEVFGELVLRVGVATGQAVVGPCGSSQKYDYTCIGDTVNLAARLESANKFYGTQILVGEGTRAQVADRFVFRPLGGVQVKGKRQPVPIHELLDRAGEVGDELGAYARAFGEAVALFRAGNWVAARAAFEACRSRRSDDLAAQRYLEALAAYGTETPPADWSGALELTEK